jgi:hypothetical protein
MPIRIFRCPGCGWSGKSLKSKVEQCPDCEGTEVSVDVISTTKGANIERVPGGYDSLELEKYRRSEDGQAKEIEYLVGNNNASY